MDKRVLRERMRKKQQQIRRRQMMKKWRVCCGCDTRIHICNTGNYSSGH